MSGYSSTAAAVSSLPCNATRSPCNECMTVCRFRRLVCRSAGTPCWVQGRNRRVAQKPHTNQVTRRRRGIRCRYTSIDLAKVRSHAHDLQYKDPDVVSKIKQATGDSIHIAFDTIAVLESQSLTIKTFGPGPGRIIVIQSPQQEAQKLNPEVKIQRAFLHPLSPMSALTW